MKNTQLLNIWKEMQSSESLGMVKRALSNTAFRLYCIYTYPENAYGIALSFSDKIKVDVAPFANLKELDVRLLKDKSFKDAIMLVVQIANEYNREIFSVLSSDLINTIDKCKEEKEALRVTISQLARWKKMFDVTRSHILSPEAQQGLYGELYFLRKLLKKSKDSQTIISTWVGPSNEIRDFEGEKWTVEVKTSITALPQSLKINGERQLDDTLVDRLFLFHLSLQKTSANGETLPGLINEINNHIEGDMLSKQLFDAKLFEVGYSTLDIDDYLKTYYIIRGEKIYEVKDEFPRIKESDLKDGVGNVHYEISISSCMGYTISEHQLLDQILP